MSKQLVEFADLGLIAYKEAWDIQEQLLKQKVELKSIKWQAAGEDQEKQEAVVTTVAPHHLFFVEHPAVYTLGKSGKKENVLLSDEQLSDKHIEFFNTNRGGDITFHGPGQIVAYPVLDLEYFYTDIGKYLRNLEQVIIDTLADYEIVGERSAGETGVWLQPGIVGRERKICAIGVRCSRWITMHGLAFNVNTDLSYFNHIIPCGIVDKQVTSLEKELGRSVDIREVKEKIKKNFENVFDIVLIG